MLSLTPGGLWPWVVLAGLGCFHGVNPAMGWLFSVALGLHRHSRKIVALSWIPIALGHAAAVALVLFAVLALGLVLNHAVLSRAAAALLLGWALWHAIRGHRQRLRVGMQTGLTGLAFWSFLMSSAHGAGLMLVPVLLGMPAGPDAPDIPGITTNTLVQDVAAVTVHSVSMLLVMGVIALIVYERLGLNVLRKAWLNVDLIWSVAVIAAGVVMLFT